MRRKILVALFLLVGMASCTVSTNKPMAFWEENGKLKVLTTTAMIEDLVKGIGGEQVDTLTLIRGELDPHSYELVKGDDERFECADLVLYNGLGLEHALSLRQKLASHPHAIGIADPILKENPKLILKHNGQTDPHVWMDISLWMRTIDPIVAALSEKLPEHAKTFALRGEELKEEFKVADRIVYRTMQAIPAHRRYLITSHDAFHYFARRYLAEPGERNWQLRCAAPEGLAPDAQLSLTDIYSILALIEKHHVNVLFPESNLSRDALRKITRAGKERGWQVMLAEQPLYGDSMGEASNYLEMISHNVNVIAHELMRSE